MRNVGSLQQTPQEERLRGLIGVKIMGKQKQNKNKLFRGLGGTDIKYLKDSIKHGHLEDGTGSTKKQQHKYSK